MPVKAKIFFFVSRNFSMDCKMGGRGALAFQSETDKRGAY